MKEVKCSYYQLENKRKAYFVILGTGLLSILSLGALIPLGNYLFNRYFIPRKYIDNRQLTYKGRLWVLFVIFYVVLIGLLLCVFFLQIILNHYNLATSGAFQTLNAIPATLGAIIIQAQTNKYNQKSTHFIDEKGKKSGFHFKLFYFLGKYVLTKIINYASLALLYPLSTRLSVFYDYKRGYIDGYYFTYHFSMRKTYPRYLLDLLLCIITLGLYIPMLLIRRYTSDQEFVHIKDIKRVE